MQPDISASTPPPLPGGETAFATYAKAFATIFPAFFICVFSDRFMLPKLQWLWARTKLSGSKIQWLVDASHFLIHSMPFIAGAVVLLLIVLERCLPSWPRWRRAIVSMAAILFHTAVLLGLTAISVSVLVAAPILTTIKK